MSATQDNAANAPIDADAWLAMLVAIDEKPKRMAAARAVLRQPEQLRALAESDLEVFEADLKALITTDLAGLIVKKAAETRPPRQSAPPPSQNAQPHADSLRSGPAPEAAVLDLLQRGKPTEAQPRGVVKSNAWNLGTILRNDSRWRGRFVYDELLGAPTLDRGPLEDVVSDVNVGRWISEVYGLDYRTNIVREQIASVANDNRVNPVVVYLDDLTWDGTERLDDLMSDHFGAEKTTMNAAVGRAWMISMVARAYDPGCQVDTVPILVGAKQGTFKSTTLAYLMPDPAWFSRADIPFGHHQDRYQQLRGRWMYEVAEIDRLLRSRDASDVKAFVTQADDDYRKSHGFAHARYPRRVVFVGTTNEDEFLVDSTGARRFWPVRVLGDCSRERVGAARDQLWAEAVAAYRKCPKGRVASKSGGESWWLSGELVTEAAKVAEEFAVVDPWHDLIAQWAINNQQGTVYDILSGPLNLPTKDQSAGASSRVRAILRRMGWKSTGARDGERGKTGSRIWRPDPT